MLCLNSFIAFLFQQIFKGEGVDVSQTTRFWAWNIKAMLFNESMFIGLPFYFEDPTDTTFKKRSGNTYIRQHTTLDPRRPHHVPSPINQQDSSICVANLSLSIQVNQEVNKLCNCNNYCRKHGVCKHDIKKNVSEKNKK